MTDAENKKPKFHSCEIGPFRLPGITIDPEQVTEDELKDMQAWAGQNHAFVSGTLLSWRSAKHRDWFILKWG